MTVTYAEMSFHMLAKLRELCPMMDLDGEDRRVYKIADADLRFYIRWLYRYGDLDEYDVLLSGKLSPDEINEFVEMWTSQWWKKYQQRTKIVIGHSDKQYFAMRLESNAKSDMLWRKVSPKEHQSMRTHIAFSLIQNGEICCLDIIADHVLMEEYFKSTLAKKPKLSSEDKLNLTLNAQRHAKRLCYTDGPIVFIKYDYNQANIREFRDDGTVRGTP